MKGKTFERLFNVNVNEVNTHELANLTPTMSEEDFNRLKLSIGGLGQLQPIVMYQGKMIDGRHRLKALKELDHNSIIVYKNLKSNLTYEEVREMVVNGFENRRHETPTQKAIMAWYHIQSEASKGHKVSQTIAAHLFGTNRMLLGRVKKLEELRGKDIIKALFDGQKIKLASGSMSDSLISIIKHYEALNEADFKQEEQKIIDLTDEEKAFVNDVVTNLSESYNTLVLKAISSKLFHMAQ